ITGEPVSKLVGATGIYFSSFAEDTEGELLAVSYYTGTLHRLAPAPDAGSSDPTQPAAGLIPYDVNSPLWSDGADKQRFMALPDSQAIAIVGDGDWDLPVFSVLMQTFSVAG